MRTSAHGTSSSSAISMGRDVFTPCPISGFLLRMVTAPSAAILMNAFACMVPPPPNPHRAIFVERFTGFQPGEFPLYDTLKQALAGKYGAPSFDGDGVKMWTFNPAGVQIVDNNVGARCGKFPPTDPPARGQNVLFNGYKTAGCGTTLYVRYERGSGPSDRDLVRWMSVSLIDDSQFDEMRNASARFATQATRDTASRVGAPKL